MCDTINSHDSSSIRGTVPVTESAGTVLAHDITEIRPGKFKGRAFRKGHIIKAEDIEHLQRLGKNNIFVLKLADDEMHENDAALAMARALMGEGVRASGEPKEGKINIVADRDGLLCINREALLQFNMLGEVMCASMHNNSVVEKDRTVAGTRAIPLVVKKTIVEQAVSIAGDAGGIVSVKAMRKPNAGLVITGEEVYSGRIKDAFEPVIRRKIEAIGGHITAVHFAPDNAEIIESRISDLIATGCDLIITTGGMSVDPDDVTRFAIRNLGVDEMYYGSPVLPGAMFLVAYLKSSGLTKNEFIPVLGIPACGMYASTTIFDLLLPRILAGEHIGRRQIAELGHGGLCLKCKNCTYPVCPFGK